MDTGRLLLRMTIGPLFVGHGTQKLFGWFGGHGLAATGQAFEQMGFRPGRRHAMGAGAAEAAGGTLIALGALTPLAASLLTGVMVTAIRKVHARNGVWVTDGGFEYNAVLIAAVGALVEQGPGRPSVDAAVLPRAKGATLALASLVAGAAGSFLNERLFSEPEPPPDVEQADHGAQQAERPAGNGASSNAAAEAAVG